MRFSRLQPQRSTGKASAVMQRSTFRLLSRICDRMGARRLARPLKVFRNYGFEPDKKQGEDNLTFTDHAAIFEGRNTTDLLRALLVLRLCATPPFVTNSKALLDSARRLLGDTLALGAVQASFYSHFCAGKEAADVWARMNALRAHGIGAILDYAEEEDIHKYLKQQQQQQQQEQEQQEQEQQTGPHVMQAAVGEAKTAAAPGEAAAAAGGIRARGGSGRYTALAAPQLQGGDSLAGSRVVASTYDHSGDFDPYDRRTAAFLSAIDTAATLPGQGFAAVKLTALGDPGLLEHLSASLDSVRRLFTTYDLDGDGSVTQAEFDKCFQKLAAEQGSASSAAQRREVWQWLDPNQDGCIDYVSWTQRLDLQQLPALAAALEKQATETDGGPGRPWELTAEEQNQLQALLGRLEALVERAVSKGVKLMIDAEQSSLRPAIDHVAHELMRRHNSALGGAGAGPGGSEAVIFGTYQTYLRDSRQRLKDDLARAERERYTVGVKLVRGAYLNLERRRAAAAGVPSPVWDRIEQTHSCFSDCLDLLLRAVRAGRAEVMVGSHNQDSVEAAVAAMAELGLDPEEAPVYFGQLMGMADSLSFTLGHHGYKVFKYCPYGSVEKVIPYLLRRVNENEYILKGGKQDMALLWAELQRRTLRDPDHSVLARILCALQRPSSNSSPSSVA